MWVPACDILSLHFSALPSHHKTQQETGSLPLPTPFLHEFFLLLIAHSFPLSYSKFHNFFSLTHRPKTTYTMANSEPTTVNTTNSHKTKTKTKKISTKRKSNHQLQPQKEKNSNHQYHHQPHKPTSIIAQASNHNYKHRKPKHTNTKSSD